MKLVRLKTLDLREGDTAVTPKGTFVVTAASEVEVDVLWLETKRQATIWLEDLVYGPVEVLRKPA